MKPAVSLVERKSGAPASSPANSRPLMKLVLGTPVAPIVVNVAGSSGVNVMIELTVGALLQFAQITSPDGGGGVGVGVGVSTSPVLMIRQNSVIEPVSPAALSETLSVQSPFISWPLKTLITFDGGSPPL